MGIPFGGWFNKWVDEKESKHVPPTHVINTLTEEEIMNEAARQGFLLMMRVLFCLGVFGAVVFMLCGE